MASGITIDARAFVEGAARQYREFKTDGEEYVESVANQVAQTARSLAPVRTGRLASSINVISGADARGPYADVGTNVEYAIFVEFGTYKDRAQHFMLPALGAAGRGARRGGIKTTTSGRRASLFRRRERARATIRQFRASGQITSAEALHVSRQLSNSSRYRYTSRRRRR